MILNKIFITVIFFFLATINLQAHETAILDYEFLLLQSKAGQNINLQVKKIDEKNIIKFVKIID